MAKRKTSKRSRRAGSRPTTSVERVEDVLARALLEQYGCVFLREYQPCEHRLWAIDLALPEQLLAVEIEGRFHLKCSQHRKDCEKQNWLASNGWACMRYPAGSITTKSRLPLIVEQIWRVACGATDPQYGTDILTGAIR